MILLNLFLSFLRIGLFAIGGAYSFLPLIEREVVHKYGWLTKNEFLDVMGMVRIFPGAISIKFATYTGFKIAGIPGVIVANLGNILGPLGLIIFASSLYARYKDLPSVQGAFSMIQMAIFAMILAVAFQLVNTAQLLSIKHLSVVVISFILFFYAKLHPAIIIIAVGLIGAFMR
ncbi:MAG: chromate transporter [Candidatus Omnitrophica bacterium]|nr:chromate transporter [Candidatus Omnitrophota bacterium]MBU4149119.1 chromate transporter [Candidatus Omnitrophota bacterium]